MTTDNEQICLVDEDDNLIEVKDRAKLTNDDCWRIVSIWVTNPEGKILLQQRNKTKKILPGVWTAAVEGTVTHPDSYIETALKEVSEEIGLSDLELTPGKKYYGKWGNFGKRQAQSYRAIYNDTLDKLKLEADEVAGVAWFTKVEIEKMYTENPELFPLYEQYKFFEFL